MNPQRLLQHFDRIAEAPDAVARLRRFILDLAVRGKLVEQDPDDEPATELLKRIQEEKVRLVKGGETRDKLWLPAVASDEMPFPIPTAWRWCRFTNLADFSAGRTPSRNEPSFWDSGEHAWVSIADMEDGAVVTDTKETVSGKARERVFGRPPQPPGTIIMSFKLTIGKIARLGIPAFHNEAIISIRPYLADLDAYLFKVLPEFARQGNTKGAIKGATLNRDSISNILLPLPPLAEQHRIVAKVDELMALCDRLEAAQKKREQRRDQLNTASLNRINQPGPFADGDAPTAFREHARFHLDHLPRLTTRPEHIKSLRRTILNLAVRGKLVEQDPEDEPASELLKAISETRKKLRAEKKIPKPKALPVIDELDLPFVPPSGWIWAMLGELCYLVADGPHFSPQYVPAENGVPFLSTRNVRPGRFDLSTVKYVSHEDHEQFCTRIKPERDDIIYTKGGTTGIAKVNDLEFEFSVWVHLAVLRIEKQRLLPRYVELALNSPHCYEQSQRYTQGTSNFDLGLTRMIKITIPLPPLAEQHRIVARVDELMAICDQLEAQLTITQTDSRRLLEAVLHEALA
ncbi:MAG: restriction endonuclease [Gammaproteobacteria bacterium]|nr:restriction endonuclease [Gammaproteobacteria bacterium]